MVIIFNVQGTSLFFFGCNFGSPPITPCQQMEFVTSSNGFSSFLLMIYHFSVSFMRLLLINGSILMIFETWVYTILVSSWKIQVVVDHIWVSLSKHFIYYPCLWSTGYITVLLFWNPCIGFKFLFLVGWYYFFCWP